MATHATMVLKRVRRKGVPRINPKKSLPFFYGEIVIYPQGQLVEENVAIWAKTKDVFWDIRPIMGTTKCACSESYPFELYLIAKMFCFKAKSHNAVARAKRNN